MEKYSLSGLVLGIILLMSSWAFGQSKPDSLRQKHTENVTIYGTSNPVIRQAEKINRKPLIPKIKAPSTDFLSPFTAIKFPTSIRLKPIKPFPVKVNAGETSWNSYLTGGLGSRISPYVEFFNWGGKKNRYHYQAHIRQFSTFKNIKDYLPSPYSQLLAELDGTKYFRYHMLSMHASYGFRAIRYYGYNTSLDTVAFDQNDSLFKQNYHLANLAIDFSSIYKNFDKLHHTFKLNGNYFYDRYGSSEGNLTFNFDLHKAFHVTRLFDHQQLGWEGEYAFYDNKTRYLQQSDHHVRMMPYFDARYGMLNFKAGIRMDWLRQLQSTFHFYPYLRVNLELVKNSLGLFGGIEGGLDKNSRAELSRKNPYLNTFENDYRWQNTKWKVYAGFKGNVAKRLDFSFSAMRSGFENRVFFDYSVLYYGTGPFPLYYSAANLSYYNFRKNEFVLKYANGKSWTFEGSLNWSNSPVLNVWVKGRYRQFDLEYDMYPLYQPSTNISIGASTNILGKYTPWIEVIYVGKRWATMQMSYPVLSSNVYELNAYTDINVGVEYQLNKQFSAFARVTNLLNKQYFRFNNYPVAGLEIMLGVSYKF